MAYELERRIIEAHQLQRRQIVSRVSDYLGSEWMGLGSWRDDEISKFVDKAVKLVESGQKNVWQLTNAYLDTLARANGFKLAPGSTPETIREIRGVPALEVYRRPAVTVYTALSEGKAIDEAVKLGLYRLNDLVQTDMQLAHNRAAWKKLRASDIQGYRRVLTGFESCALCELASTQRYHKWNLSPIHPGCDCGVAPIFGESDPGQVINEDRLNAINEAVSGDTHATSDGKKDRTWSDVMVREHGEYGPTLSWREQAFTSQADL
jgi:hypothetical protein